MDFEGGRTVEHGEYHHLFLLSLYSAGLRQQQADWTLDMHCAALTVCRWSCWSVRQAWQLNWRRSSVLLASSVSFMRLVGSPGHQPVEATGPVVPGPGERDDRA